MTFEEIENLSGAELDYQVALLEGLEPVIKDGSCLIPLDDSVMFDNGGKCEIYKVYSPSQNWADGGPIIEREGFFLGKFFEDRDGPIRVGHEWVSINPQPQYDGIVVYGNSALIAVMRCYLAIKIDTDG